jgi:hypothetical protein
MEVFYLFIYFIFFILYSIFLLSLQFLDCKLSLNSKFDAHTNKLQHDA